jgi:hypothetical protein
MVVWIGCVALLWNALQCFFCGSWIGSGILGHEHKMIIALAFQRTMSWKIFGMRGGTRSRASTAIWEAERTSGSVGAAVKPFERCGTQTNVQQGC